MDRSIPKLAEQIATRAHACQRDKAGQPYIEHPRRVATYVNPHDDNAIAAALLHDVLEDTAITSADLVEQGMPAIVIEAIELLTHRPRQQLAEYYGQIRHHPLAREVKLADLADNTDPVRLAMLSGELRRRLLRKYANAYRALGTDVIDGSRRRASRVQG